MTQPPPRNKGQLELGLGRYVKAGTDHTIARNTLGLTAYLADPEYWAREGARRMLETFLDLLPKSYLEYLRSLSSFMTDTVSDPRHYFWIKLHNDIGATAVGFSYTEIDPKRAERSAVIELTLPQEHDPGDLFQLALELANLGPVHSIVGGFVLRYDDHHKAKAFNQIYRWVSRYIGLDVQVPDEMAWKTQAELPGTNWLTMLGEPLVRAREIDLDELKVKGWTHDIAAIPARGGLLLRAGDTPVMGDRNRMIFPQAYAEVARALEPYIVAEPPEFYPFDHTTPWFRRLIDVKSWAELPGMRTGLGEPHRSNAVR